jgi:type IV pilus assembly protein PilV
MNLQPLRTPQQGFSLMEVLVTVLVLAIGLLGLASLQLNALRNSTSAYERSQATILAYEIVDRMRTNRTAARAGAYDIALEEDAGAADCIGATCSPDELAVFDVAQWKGDVARLLPAGDAAVATNAGVVTVTIQWTDDRATAGAAPVAFTMSTVL